MHGFDAYETEALAVGLLPSPGMGLAEQAMSDETVDVMWAEIAPTMRSMWFAGVRQRSSVVTNAF